MKRYYPIAHYSNNHRGLFFLHAIIDWKKQLVWVDYKERHQVAQKVKQFHSALSKEDFIDLQHSNRILWLEKLTMGGVF